MRIEPKLKLNHLYLPLVAGCNIAHKLFHVSRWDRDRDVSPTLTKIELEKSRNDTAAARDAAPEWEKTITEGFQSKTHFPLQ